jgi:hypothetical protein
MKALPGSSIGEEGDEVFLDLATVQALLNSSTVFAVEPEHVPEGKPLAALFRYD